jgi:hypothetical protein
MSTPYLDGKLGWGHTSFTDTADERKRRIDTKDGSPADPVDISRGLFGAIVGIDRLLKLWDRYNIKVSWFVPAHSLESFPAQVARIRDAGHEMYVRCIL